MSIGTITSESSILVRYMGGGTLGTIEESFIARIKPGDRFVFAGQTLELVRYRDMTAYVRKSTRTSGIVPALGRRPVSALQPIGRGGAAAISIGPAWAFIARPKWRPFGRCWSCKPAGPIFPGRTSCCSSNRKSARAISGLSFRSRGAA